jgi:hypothetical protein
MASDFAALSRAPLTVSVGGHTFTLPWQPAAEWALNLERLPVLVSRLAPQDVRDEMAQLLMTDPSAMDGLRAESYRILAEQTGRKWWEGGRLLATSGAPDILGRLTLAGVDPWSVSVGQWCAATYALCVKGADDKGRMKFDFSLSIPPEGFEDEWDDGADDAEQIAAAVSGLMG